MNKKNIMIAMSGGVDSSVAAHLLKEQGFSPTGATMCFGLTDVEKNPKSCCDPQSVSDAKRVCGKLGIPHHVFDYAKELKEFVIDNFVNEYKKGRTPNPCVRCNSFLKFGILLHRSKEMGFDAIATGHYAKITEDESGFHLETADDKNKDQTYFLWGIKKRDLSEIMFPVGNIEKPDLRKTAEIAGIPTAQKQDSQDICFVSGKNYRTLLAQYGVISKKGKMIHVNGKILGEHFGIENYTVGQRKGLGIALGEPAFVKDVDVEKNIVVIGNRNDLLSNGCVVGNCNELETFDGSLSVKIRSTMTPVKCCVQKLENGRIKILFDEPQFAVTAGQSAVIYNKKRVICGGIIEEKC
ncbi:MAG: tRNA 2-thiouridine(34) synthase MnmA [Chitinispirillales bacterium]|jgi:tRNA-specific 2-thiouridylase|nr:tRNA 2-thiouridine(34) synthase MnmA [Chitinispirillales bacterium]